MRRTQQFPDEWERYLRQNVAQYRLLGDQEQERLRTDAQILASRKTWEGCAGVAVTDEMKATVAAQAALMLLHIEHDYFRRVSSILIYPSTFVIPGGDWMDEVEQGFAASGQSVYRGPVILAWDAVLAEGRDPSSGRNVVIHEFAHQLDYLDGSVNGTPDLMTPEEGARWQEVMTSEFDRVRRAIRLGRRTFLGNYATQNEPEFFAVASERFFTLPAKLRRIHPDLYEVLKSFYRVDPIEWFARGDGVNLQLL